MITFRNQPWKLSPSRAWEFHRTSRRVDQHPWLTVWMGSDPSTWTCASVPVRLRLQISRDKVRPLRAKELQSRPMARVLRVRRSGPMRCVKALDWFDYETFISPPHPHHRRRYGLPPASGAWHFHLRQRYETIPF